MRAAGTGSTRRPSPAAARRRARLRWTGAAVVGCAVAVAVAVLAIAAPSALHAAQAGHRAGVRAAMGGGSDGTAGTRAYLSLASFRPSWMPTAMVEASREMIAGDGELSITRQWIQVTAMNGPLGGDGTSGPMLSLQVGSRPPPSPQYAQRAEVQGHSALLAGPDPLSCELTWLAAPGRYVLVYVSRLQDPCAVTLRFARSLKPAPLRLRSGFLRMPHTGKVYASLTWKAAGCEMAVSVPAAGATATLGPDPLPPGGRAIRVNGRAARLYSQTGPIVNSGKPRPGSRTAAPKYPKVTIYQVGIDFGPGRRLYVAMARPRETGQLVERLAAGIRVGAAPVCGF